MKKTYSTKEVVAMLGISRNTLYNWFTKRKIAEVVKDRNKKRIYTEADVERMKTYKNTVISPTRTR